MKNVLRRFLIICYIAAVVCGLLGYRLNEVSVQERVRLMNDPRADEFLITKAKNSQEFGAIMFLSAPGVIILCYLSHFIFLGISNPLRLFKPIESDKTLLAHSRN
jgi:hypothetical protein